jgi:hypothetical protein
MIAGRGTAIRATAVVAFALATALAPSTARADDKACMAAAAKGQELRDEGKLVEAKPLFQQCADAACPAPIPGYCADWLADLVKKMPSVVFRATDENGRDITDASAEIDGKRTVAVDGRSVEIDPGKHTIKVVRPGSKPFEDVVIIAQSEKDRIVLAKLAPAAAPAVVPPPVDPKKDAPKKSGVPTSSVVAWGVGAVALLSFAGFGLKARVDYDDYADRCGNRCAESERDTVATSVLIADISLVVAIVAAGVGTYFYLTRPTTQAPAKEAAR